MRHLKATENVMNEWMHEWRYNSGIVKPWVQIHSQNTNSNSKIWCIFLIVLTLAIHLETCQHNRLSCRFCLCGCLPSENIFIWVYFLQLWTKNFVLLELSHENNVIAKTFTNTASEQLTLQTAPDWQRSQKKCWKKHSHLFEHVSLWAKLYSWWSVSKVSIRVKASSVITLKVIDHKKTMSIPNSQIDSSKQIFLRWGTPEGLMPCGSSTAKSCTNTLCVCSQLHSWVTLIVSSSFISLSLQQPLCLEFLLSLMHV